MYAVVIYEVAAKEIEPLLKPWLRRSSVGAYFLSPKINPSEPYFRLELQGQGGTPQVDFELQLPHGFIKAVLHSRDIKQLGFA
jgi:hypothetical protein